MHQRRRRGKKSVPPGNLDLRDTLRQKRTEPQNEDANGDTKVMETEKTEQGGGGHDKDKKGRPKSGRPYFSF